MRALLVLTFVLVGCRSEGLVDNADGGDEPGSCASHTDRASCTADSACFADGCAGCNDANFSFLGCYRKGTQIEHSCPSVSCPPISSCADHTDEASCTADSRCVPEFVAPSTCTESGPTCAMFYSDCLDGPVTCVWNESSDCGLSPTYCGEGYAWRVEDGCTGGCIADSYCTPIST